MGHDCKAAIIGVGNRLFGDDGFGSCLAEALRKCSRGDPCIYSLERLGPGDAWVFTGKKLVIFIDVVEDERVERGWLALYKIDPYELSNGEAIEIIRQIDPHEIDPARLAVLAYVSGILDAEVLLVGIRGYNYEFGQGVSEELIARGMRIVDFLAKLLYEKGYRLEIDEACMEASLRGCSRPP